MNTIEQGLIDIRNKAREISRKSTLGTLEPYPISCGTLIAIINALEEAHNKIEQIGRAVEIENLI